ncbi:MAG: opacity protein-like surface antigen [Chitinophagales bacterium]|jgi:opacity protein-like surface antigen
MKTITKIFIASSLVLISLQSDAKSPSFTYVGAEYVASGEIRVADDSLSIDIDTDGFALSASAELGIFLVQLSQLTLESDEFLGASIEDSITTLGVGITFKLPQTQLYALVRGRYDNLKLKGGELFDDESADGGIVGGEIGVRFNLTDRFELNASIGKPSSDEGDSFGVGAQFFVTENVGVTIDFRSIEAEQDEFMAEFDTTSIGVRYTF